MKPGHLSATKGTSTGFGWHSIATPVKLSGFILATAVGLERKPYGTLCLPFIVSAHSVTAISGTPMTPFYLRNGIDQSAKTVGRPTTSSASTAPYGSGFLDWFVRRYRSPRNSKTILELSGILSTTTMHPYLFRTTEFCTCTQTSRR